MKKCLSILLVALMLLCMVPTTVFAAGNEITSVSLGGLEVPIVGDNPTTTAGSDHPDKYKVKSISWEESDEDYTTPETTMTDSHTFRQGRAYWAFLTLEAQGSYVFAQNITGTINGKTANTHYHPTNNGKNIVVYIYFDSAKKGIKNIDLATVMPVVGKYPTFGKVNTEQYYSTNFNLVTNCTNGITWTNQSSGVNLTISNTFKENVTYQLTYYLATNEGYAFSLGAKATINGKAAEIAVIQDNYAVVWLSDIVPSYSRKEVKVNNTGIYDITPNITLTGFDKDSITVYDQNNGIVKYNDTKGGWPLVKDLTYCVQLNENLGNTNNLNWNLTKKADTIFPDTQANGWYNDAVTYAVGAGIMSGYNNGKFGTSDSIQRQDFLVMLARLDGVDLDTYGAKKSAFSDVPEGSYFEAAVNWGAENGIVTGYNSYTFGVGDKVTREQLVTFLYRYAKYKGYDYSYTSNRETIVSGQYNDYKKVSGFAKDPILWAIEKGVISGKTSTTIVPQGNAQRCEVAKIMYNIFLNDIFNNKLKVKYASHII